MIITKHSNNFFKFIYGKNILAVNPASKESGKETTRFNANIAISTLANPCCNGFDLMTSKNNTPFIIKGAGEYEVSDIFVKGYGLKNKIDEKEYMTTSYTFTLDSINITFFGQISDGEEFSNEAYEDFLKSDIIIIPIGGGDVFTPKEAAKFAKKFNAKIIIPTSYGEEELKEFLTIFSSQATEEMDKLTIKVKDIEDKINEIVILQDLSK